MSGKAPTLEEMKKHLKSIDMLCKVEQRGDGNAISFTGYPCPSCKKTNGNSKAYPYSYTLHCFNKDCDASGGLLFHKWAPELADLIPSYTTQESLQKFNIFPPDQHVTIEETRQRIREELLTPDNTLMLMTPGVGKSTVVRCEIPVHFKEKTVIYSTYNRKLKKEAFDHMKSIASDMNLVLLDSKEEVCLKKDQLISITKKGYSPSDMLCSRCELKIDCQYYNQRKEFEPGVYFVTHHMLKYIEEKIPNPDLLILDEDILRGFLHKETFSDAEFKRLLSLEDLGDKDIIESICEIAFKLSIEPEEDSEKVYGRIIEFESHTDPDKTSIMKLLCEKYQCGQEEILSRC